MKSHLLALLLGAASAPLSLSAQILASWNFDSATISGAATDFGPIAADFGTGSAAGHHTSSATTWSSPVGNGSAKSFSANTWGVGDYFQFSTSTTGASGISLAWDQTGSSTGPRDFKLQYSLNGTSWTDFASYTVQVNGTPNTAWTGSGSPNPAFNFSLNLSSITALDNQPNAFFRLTDTSTVALNGGAVATAGSDRVDNFAIHAIPEPPTFALLAGLVGFGVVLRRRLRSASALA